MMRTVGTTWCTTLLMSAAIACGDSGQADGPMGPTVPAGSTTTTGTDADPSSTNSSPSTVDGMNDDSGPATTAADGTTTADDTDASGSSGGPPSACGEPPVWCPGPGTSWHWQLTGAVEAPASVTMVDLDLFDVDAERIAQLRRGGQVVICYFSAGSHEDWRPDADQYPPAAIGSTLDDWPGERWIDIRDPVVREVLAARLDLAVDKGYDGVEPDNVDGYINDTGFPLTGEDQLDFNRWLAAQAHQRALSVGLKNDLDQVEDLLSDFDWSLDEECVTYDECDRLMPFIAAGKAVFHVEYVDDPAQGPELAAQICPDALDRSFSTLVKHWDLDAWGIACE